MTISRVIKRPKERHFAVYDLEWNPDTMVPRLYGLFDGSHYRAFKSVNAFMEAMLRPEYAGWWFFAHAGGLADVPFLLQWMVDHPGYEVKARFSGSAAVMVEICKKVKVRRKDGTVGFKVGSQKWTLVDSFFLLRTKLRNIGQWLGEAKGGAEGSTDIFYAPWNELRIYNEQDCRILHRGISVFQDQLEELGGELMPTIASTAMRLFRRQYLRDDIRTAAGVNTQLRESYVASRVEVFLKKITDARQYDINSSFPFSMTKPVPGELMFVSKHLPDSESECFFADVEITVPEMDIPPLPYRQHGKVYFPTGTWSGWMSGVDIRFLVERGGRINKVRESYVYEERDDLASYVNDLYERRRVATTDFEKVIYKFLLNSLYGKFGERTEKTTLILNPISTNMLVTKYDKKGRVVRKGERLFPGAILITEDRPIAHEHVPIASHVTANSRRLISNILYDAADKAGEIPAYADSVTGDRTVVVRSPDGRTIIEPIEELWERAARSKSRDGKERATLRGWHALAMDEYGNGGWFPVASIIRHEVSKDVWLVSTSRGQTEVTRDHGIMVAKPSAHHDDLGVLEAVAPKEFVESGHRFVKVPAARSGEAPLIDLWDELKEFAPRQFELCDDGRSVRLVGRSSGTIRRWFHSGSDEAKSLMRLIGAYVSEGSASVTGVTAVRTVLSIAQKDRKWVEAIGRDLSRVSDARWSVIETGGGMWALRGATFLAHLFWALCGIKSRGKKLPSFCYDLVPSDRDELWRKLVDGDGCIDSAGRHLYTTTSQRLAAGVSYLLDQHGVDHAICYRESKRSWTLRERPVGSERVDRKVKHSRREGSRMVYDLSVEGARTFVDGVGRVLLHNTDCVVTRAELSTSDALGALKLERDIKMGEFFAPKFYRIDGHVKAKGFSRITSDGFQLLVDGYAGQFERQARPREMLRRGDLTPRRLHIPKQLRFRTEDEKRVFAADGMSSRPFSVSEIEARFAK